jgi:hypothetical protein
MTHTEQEFFDLECIALGRLNTLEVRERRITELERQVAERDGKAW